MIEKKRKPKASGPRTEVFAMRLDPKLKYLSEIAARKQRRSLANFVEWAVEEALAKVKLVEDSEGKTQRERSVRDEAATLWDLEPSDRFMKLAESYPDLLTYEEQMIWKAISEVRVNEHAAGDAGKSHVLFRTFLIGKLSDKKADRNTVKECWPTLVAYSEGNATEQDLRQVLSKTASPEQRSP